jgi:N-acetylmuramic acid 6-phosphate etherase
MTGQKKRERATSPTERRHPLSRHIDSASPFQIARIMNQEDCKVAPAVRGQLGNIARAIEMASAALSGGGRLFYVGAGTSGRLGVLDAVECLPTFNVSPQLVQGILAGGTKALWRSVEGAEDDITAGARAIRKAGVRAKDVVCGISASGKTPFVLGALTEAKRREARCLLVSCHPSPQIAPLADVSIRAAVGPEVIAGSTRLKAGTATKMVLNMLSSGIMIQLGKVYRNLMVDVKPLSLKLRDRAVRIIMSVLKCSRPRAQELLRLSRNQTKVAIVMGRKKLGRRAAMRLLEEKQGFLGKIL